MREGLEWIIALTSVSETGDDVARRVRELCGAALQHVPRRERRGRRHRPKRRARRRRAPSSRKSSHGARRTAQGKAVVTDARPRSKRARLKRRIDCVSDDRYLEWVGMKCGELLRTMPGQLEI